MLSDREAADRRAGQIAGEISNRVHAAIHARPADAAMVMRRELMTASKEMFDRLCEIYAPLPGAADPPLVDELTTLVADRVCAFIQSTASSAGISNRPGAARLAANLMAGVRMGASTTFQLAAYEAHKDRPRSRPPPAPVPKIDEDARTAFDRLPIHPDIRAACGKQFADGHYRDAVLNAGIALVEYVKLRAGSPKDTKGKALDGTSLMQRVFGGDPPILKVNELKTPTDQDEQQGMQFLFAGATLGLRNPRAHSLDPDTAEYAAEAVALISFLYKVAESSTT